LLIVFQIWVAAGIAFQPFNAAQGSYRRDERAVAFRAMEDFPSAETKAALQRELHLSASISFTNRLASHPDSTVGAFLLQLGQIADIIEHDVMVREEEA
jgi:hypothetical protein